MTITPSGKYIIIGYDNGAIEKYVFQKINSSKINNNINNNNNMRKSSSNEFRLSDLSSQNSGIRKIHKRNIFNKLISGLTLTSRKSELEEKEKEKDNESLIQKTSVFIEPKNINNNDILLTINTTRGNNTKIKLKEKSHINKIIFDNKISISFSNILNSDCILLNKKSKKFLQYNGTFSQIFKENVNTFDGILGYNIHSMKQSELKKLSKISNENNTNTINNQNQLSKKYFLFLVNSSSRIIYPISLIEICEAFSLMIIVDKLNKIYLYDFNSFNLIKYIDFSYIFNSKIKYINICPYTGEFILGTKRDIVLLNINGVILAKMNNDKNKINSCFISLIPNTQNDLFLFTGHQDGNLLIYKLKVNQYNNDVCKGYEQRKKIVRNVYIESYNNNYENVSDMNNLPFIFESFISIKCSNNPLKYIKMKEDLTELICIDNTNQIIYLSYKEFFNKNKDKKNLKECPMCKSAISSSNILCYLCGKKLCSKCKIEEIIPEYSLKNKKAICEDCLQLINSSNKLLYEF